MLLAYKGQEWEDTKWNPMGDWQQAKKEHKFEHDELPVLVLKDGKAISQTGAILRYLDRVFNLASDDPVEAAREDSNYDLANEICMDANMSLNGLADETMKSKFLKEKFPTYKRLFQEQLRPNGFIGEKGPCHADFMMWHVCDAAETLQPDILEDVQSIKEWKKRVESLPGVSSYLAKRDPPLNKK